MIEWSEGAELQRDAFLMELHGKPLQRFEQGLKQALEQIETFPESGRLFRRAQGRSDIREVIFAGGHRLVYMQFRSDLLLILSVLPPRSSQALD